MENLLKRLAFALLTGFVTFVVALPLGCGALLLYSEHLNGDVQSGGPSELLGGMALAGVLAALVVVFVMVKTRRR